MSSNSTFWSFATFFRWLFIRLPRAFSIPFTILCLVWALFGFETLYRIIPTPEFLKRPLLLQWLFPSFVENAKGYHIYLTTLDELIHAIAVMLVFVLGLFVIYNFCVWINMFAVEHRLKRVRYSTGPPKIPAPVSVRNNPLSGVRRIGIVLAGGGAKGAFQAGAMKAIYRFLAEHNALDKVKVMSSTSIGSWNALFWLADLIAPAGVGEHSRHRRSADKNRGKIRANASSEWKNAGVHENWWRLISAKSLVAPYWYLPFFRNAFLSPTPWKQVFRHVFDRDDVKQHIFESGIHFYMTRSNVRTGEMECATNNPTPAKVNRVKFDILSDSQDAKEFLDRVETAVFASMDLPPLFPYAESDGDLYEDGGVIDNLPLSFAAREDCDLVFVLPLNADFEEEPNKRSIFVRLNRVLDVRQGALERQGFKLLYLYNELAALRQECAMLRRRQNRHTAKAAARSASRDGSGDDEKELPPLHRALGRKHKHLRVFAICPQKSFVQETINTRDLWNSEGAGVAFKEMYNATSRVLADFDFKARQSPVRVALVSRGGMVIWDDNF